MDQNTLSNLDPKLRETYERVMGTPTPAGSTPPTPQTPDASSAPTQPAATTPLMQTPLATDVKPETVTISQPLPDASPMTPLGTKKGHSGLLKILYVLGAVVFFTIYVFFWATIFSFKLPFLG